VRPHSSAPALLVLNQMATPLTWQFAEDFAQQVGTVALLTGHPDALAKGNRGGVLLFPSATDRKGSYPRRVIGWLRYCWEAVRWLRCWPRETPVLLFSTPPILPWVGWLFRVLRGQKYAVMVHDIYPEILVRTGRLRERSLVVRAWRALDRRAYERAELVMTLGDHMARTLGAGFDGRVEVVPPWADTEVIQPLPKQENWFAKEFGQLEKLTVMYSGNMGLGHDIESLLAAAEELREERRIHFMFIGWGPQRPLVEETIRTRKLDNVTLLPTQPEEATPFSFAAADVAFVTLKRELTGTMLPSKAFSFMAAGVPLLISAAEEGELAELVARHAVGWRVPPEDSGAICQLLRQLLDDEVDLEPARGAARRAAETIGGRTNSRRMAELVSSSLDIVVR
jgi:colanic acid biosynthesis glycosyl transferase WcaI